MDNLRQVVAAQSDHCLASAYARIVRDKLCNCMSTAGTEPSATDFKVECSASRKVSVRVQDAALAATRLSSCITDIAAWMSSSRLRLNPSKTVVIWLGSRHQVGKIDVHAVPILNASVSTVNTARDLGAVLDSELTMSAQVSAVCRSGLFSTSTVASGCQVVVYECY